MFKKLILLLHHLKQNQQTSPPQLKYTANEAFPTGASVTDATLTVGSAAAIALTGTITNTELTFAATTGDLPTSVTGNWVVAFTYNNE